MSLVGAGDSNVGFQRFHTRYATSTEERSRRAAKLLCNCNSHDA